MRLNSLLPPVVAFVSALAGSTTEALSLSLPPSGRIGSKHHGMSVARAARSSSTALFYKNSTKSSFDIDTAPNPLTTKPAVTTVEEDDPTVSAEDTVGKVGVGVGVGVGIESDAYADDDFAPFDDNCFPGGDENARFECDPSVAFWRNFQNARNVNGDSDGDGDKTWSAQDNLRDMNTIARKFVARGSSSYFGRHLGRTAYFGVTALLGDAAYKYSKRNTETANKDVPFVGRKGPLPMGMSTDIASRLVLETLLCYEQDYFEWIQRGVYREPWDMVTPNHRQSNPLNAITQTGRFVREAVGTLGRRSRGTERDKRVRFFSNRNMNKKSSANTVTDRTQAQAQEQAHGGKLYPDYYQTAFHYQGDGWMSTDSANVYETSTETLFLGRQDAMQRTSLPPLVEMAKNFKITHKRPMRVLEVACGTGRFMTFTRDNLPLDTEYTALDLSPFYLEKASDNDAYWRRTRASARSTNANANANTIAPATLVQAQAEDLPFADGSFDAVLCVYLFHELPRHVRAKAAAEMARVVAPGGTVVLTDSIQKGDRPALDKSLVNFEKMNEPFYIDYANDDLGAHFEAGGLVPETKIIRSTTKSLSFSKPGERTLSP